MIEIKAYVIGHNDERVTLVPSGFRDKVLVILETAVGDLEIESMRKDDVHKRHPEYPEL